MDNQNRGNHFRGQSGGQRGQRGRRGRGSNQNQNDREEPWRRNHANDQGYNSGQNQYSERGDGQRQIRNGPRGRRYVGFKYIEELIKMEDAEELLTKVKKDQEGFTNLLNSKLSNDLIVLIVKLALKLCDGSFENIVKDVITTIIYSKFSESLMLYISDIINQEADDKFRNKLFWNNPDDFWNNLLQFSEKVLNLIPTVTSSAIKKILKNMVVYFPHIQKSQNIQISHAIQVKTASLLEHVEHLLEQQASKKPVKKNDTDGGEEPPEDFREISIEPVPYEVTEMINPFLRKNVVEGPYQSIEHYLDVQFRLLREDFVSPLRKGIVTYLKNVSLPKAEKRKLENIRVYPQIQFMHVETLNECCCYKIRYDFSKKKRSFTYENSRRFMYGALVCFTNDNFRTLLFGKIVQRDAKLLEQGLLIVGFQNEVNVICQTDYIMVESTVYFEPYYQVLNVLQQMKLENFPMEKYIIKADPSLQAPEYLIRIDPIVYEIENKRFFPLNWPKNENFYNLNESQLSAFEAALTQEFSIIQGPPGTGKTFVGLKIAHTLLQNRHAWYRNTPMLVICYTNHALDQFLEGLLPVTQDILRVGGQSKNEKLNQFNIRQKKTNTYNPAVARLRREVQDALRDIKSLSDIRNNIFQNDSIISFQVFEEVVDDYRETWFYSANFDDIKKWLLEGKYQGRRPAQRMRNFGNQAEGVQNVDGVEEAEGDIEDADRDHGAWHDDIFDGINIQTYRPLIHLDQLRTRANALKEEVLKLRSGPPEFHAMLQEEKYQMEIWETEQDLNYVEKKLAENRDRNGRWDPPEHINLKNPFSMMPDQRWQLYFHWLGRYLRRITKQHENKSQHFRRIYKVYNDMRELDDAQVMKSNLVVGMTTTGAARLQSSLQALRSPIVIIEEAAEVLEAHVVAALTSHCKHLILIGDHQQLKPSAADFKIETKYLLGISLFERMVKNKIQCHVLNVQHRMRPEISSLIKPAIYKDLKDHESTLERLPILGIQKCLYFVDHQEQEEVCQDNSKKNIHEARFIIALARHLILNGYKPEQITILAAYLGQMFEMVREKKKHLNNVLLQDVRIAVLDNYQGEESDIILLSLVRSNPENKIGFLKTENRVCVALSRARDGFYIIGNMNMLCDAESEINIWNHVKKTLEEQNAIGPYLTLQCQIHSHQITQVSRAQDFLPIAEGGCKLLCEVQVSCGHICKRLCHVQDREHQLYRCREPCNRPLCETNPTHICKKMCYEECGPCTYLVERTLPECNHKLKLSCYIDINNYACHEKIYTKLPCEHEAWKPCSADAVTFRCPHPCDTRVEPCGHACDRKCHIRVDPDHLEYKCKEPCAKSKVGCTQTKDPHICKKFCFLECEPCDVGVKKGRSCGHFYTIACRLDVEDVECQKPCKKVLACGHKCNNICDDPCGPCNVMVEKTIPECGHDINTKCSQPPYKTNCKSQNCPIQLPCGHKCRNICKKPCTAHCKAIVDCNLKSPCGHTIKKISCYLRYTTDPAILLKNCSEPCNEDLKCMHKCSGTCGECLQGRIHKRCGEKCGVILVCNHECPDPCREACRPCARPCEMRCKHSKCKKKCGEPCTPCRQPCARRCPHVQCQKKCFANCNVRPCNERCSKKLKCKHDCVGFCGDPCPNMCKICNKDELTDIFLGREDEEDAIYVMLNDCGHIFESRDMEMWLNSDNGEDRKDRQVQLKVCPKCKTNITTTERYSKYAKQAMMDVIKVKEMAYGQANENDKFRTELLMELNEIMDRCPQQLQLVNGLVHTLLASLFERLQPVKTQKNKLRRQPINALELNAIKSKLQLLEEVIKCFNLPNFKYSEELLSITQVSIIISVLLRDENQITNQESDDLQHEISRLQRLVQFEQIKQSPNFAIHYSQPGKNKVKEYTDYIDGLLSSKNKYSYVIDGAVKLNLKELSDAALASVTISDREKRDIIQAIGMGKGHWYKCENGHVYVIGECGLPMQVSQCPDCKVTIGGTNHDFHGGSTSASDFVGN